MVKVILQNFPIEPQSILPFAELEMPKAHRCIFSPQLWRSATCLEDLWFYAEGHGEFTLVITSDVAVRRRPFIAGRALHLGDLLQEDMPLSFGFIAGGEGGFLATACLIGRAPVEMKRMAILTVTHERPEAWKKRAALLEKYFESTAWGGLAFGIRVDHGRGDVEVSPGVEVLRGPNLGGAGGFAKGWICARQRGAKLLLIMDDDADADVEAIHRAHVFLSFAKTENVALAGGMVTTDAPEILWEGGAVFARFCNGLHRGASLKDVKQMRRLEQGPIKGNYGGWWFFGMQLQAISHGPFPLFLRGDDVGVSLANSLRPHTLAGVIATHPPFPARERAQSLYYDLRGHLMHHMVFSLCSAWSSAWVGALFVLRSLARFRYDEAEALLEAWGEVILGPQALAAPPRVFTALSGNQDHVPIEECSARKGSKLWGMLGINGHLLPNLGHKRRLSSRQLRSMELVWGAAVITVVEGETTRTDRRNHALFWQLFLRLGFQFLQYIWRFSRLKARYKREYAAYCSEEAWVERLEGADIPPPQDQSSAVLGLPRKSLVTTT